MSFEQNMILDATTGSIARFVNHSCSPNCRMRKWTVAGQPRMALFAGDKPIMTGEELTYDYKFAPFSAKNVQRCLCGSPNCRGFLGPKQKEVKEPAAKASPAQSSSAQSRKRKGRDEDDKDAPAGVKKKRKIKAAAGAVVKRSLAKSASLKAAKGVAKGAATAIRKTVSAAISARSKKTKAVGKKVVAKKVLATKASASSSLAATARKSPGLVLKNRYGRAPARLSSSASGLTIIAAAPPLPDEHQQRRAGTWSLEPSPEPEPPRRKALDVSRELKIRLVPKSVSARA